MFDFSNGMGLYWALLEVASGRDPALKEPFFEDKARPGPKTNDYSTFNFAPCEKEVGSSSIRPFGASPRVKRKE